MPGDLVKVVADGAQFAHERGGFGVAPGGGDNGGGSAEQKLAGVGAERVAPCCAAAASSSARSLGVSWMPRNAVRRSPA